MDRKSHDNPPTLIADTESLRQQLRELHASVKAQALRAKNRVIRRRALEW